MGFTQNRRYFITPIYLTHRRSRQRWKNDMKIDVMETGCECVELIQVALETLLWKDFTNRVINLGVSYKQEIS
jgi:hypothetical protein